MFRVILRGVPLAEKFETFEGARAMYPGGGVCKDRSEDRSFDPHSESNPFGMAYLAVDAQPVTYAFGPDSFDVDGSGAGWAPVLPDLEAYGAATLIRIAGDRGVRLRPLENDDGEPCTLEGVGADWLEGTRERLAESYQDDPSGLEPAMNYYWPLPELRVTPEEAQAALEIDAGRLRPGCVVVVSVDGEPVLALVGGGMDCSDQLIAAYVTLGYYPPATIRLSHFGGPSDAHRWRVLIAASRQSQQCLQGWAAGRLEDLERLWAHLEDVAS